MSAIKQSTNSESLNPTKTAVSRKPTSFLSQVKYEHMIAGLSGGLISTLVLHPLDLIKIRFAVNDGRTNAPQYRGLTSAFTTILRQEGFRGLYKGVTPNAWGSGASWGCYFLFYNTIKGWTQSGNSSQALGPAMHMLAASEAGLLTLLITNPIWVVKTRLCLQYDNIVDPKSDKRYRGIVDCLFKIYRHEGIRGLYSGFVPGMLGVSHGAIQFMTYEELKNSFNQYRNTPIDTKLTTFEYLTFAAVSKLIAAATTYPYQVVRTRLQNHSHSYEGAWDCTKQTWKYEGWRGFYKGLQPNLTRVIPACCITFVVYENVSHFMLQQRKERDALVAQFKK